MKNKLFFFIILLIIILSVREWFSLGLLAGGDMLFFYKEMYGNLPLHPYAWDFQRGMGMGGLSVSLLWGHFVNTFPVIILGKIFHVEWIIIERIMFFYPFIILSFFSAWFFARKIGLISPFTFFAALLFTCNSYIIMIMGGGQVHFGLAYAISPLVLMLFFSIFELEGNFFYKNLLLTLSLAMLLSLQTMFDIRVALLTIFVAGLYFLFIIKSFFLNKKILQVIFFLCFSLILVILLNAYWILPTVIYGASPVEQLGQGYATVALLKYFSFAKLENTLSLLHPHWPENLFGKTYFMRPEFLLLPILAYAGLLFIKSKKNNTKNGLIIFFSSLGLLGAFLAKGANEPFGEVYIWMFERIPGFTIFRDPTKFYVFIALAYMVLIPFTLQNIFLRLQEFTKKKYMANIFLFCMLCYFFLLLTPALFGQLNGTFRQQQIPNDYMLFKKILNDKKSFFRTLWVPSVSKFAYYSPNHPAITAGDFFKDIKKEKTKNLLQESSIRYIVIAKDQDEKLSLQRNNDSKNQYNKRVNSMEKISWLKQRLTYDNFTVFEIGGFKDHFWSPSVANKISYQMINSTKYNVYVTNAKKGDLLIFAESFDPSWEAKTETKKIAANKYHEKFISFSLPESGSYKLEVSNKLQKFVDIGMTISVMSFIIISISLIFFFIKRRVYS